MRRQTKAIAISAFLCVYALLGFLFWTASSGGDERALELFKEGKYRYARVYIEELEKSSSEPRYALFQGYVLRANQDMPGSDLAFQLAAQRAEKRNAPKKMLLEIYLNQALNAYLEEDVNKLSLAIKKAERLQEADSGWIKLFSSIYAAKKGEKITEISLREKRALKYSSPWMAEAFGAHFDAGWFELNHIRSLIDSGQFIAARQKLEDLMEHALPKLRDELNFLAGFTYFKEGQARPAEASSPYYKLAFSYFDRMTDKEKLHAREWKIIASSLQANMHQLVQSSGHWSDVLFYFGLMEKLSPWIDENKLIPDLAAAIQGRTESEAEELIFLISGGPFFEGMKNYLEVAAQVAIKQKEYAKVAYYHQVSQQLTHDEHTLFSTYLSDEALRIALFDDSSLGQTIPLVTIWNQIETDPKTRLQMIGAMIHEAERIWSIYGEHKKAIALMKLAEGVCHSSERVQAHQMMESAVGDIYRSAVACDKVSQYFCVMEAVRALDLKEVDVYNRDETEHQLGDAEYYFGKHRFQEAYERALWVLQVDPNNQIANRIAGLIAHSEGHFDKALAYLGKLKKLDMEAKAALQSSGQKSTVSH